MTGSSTSRKWLWPAVAGLVLVAAIAGYAYLAPRGGLSALTGTAGTGAAGTSGGGSGAAATGGAGDGSAAAGSSGGAGSATAATSTFRIRILWWNETAARGADNVVIVWQGGSWSPDPKLKAEQTAIGPFPVGKALKLTVYPDGRSGEAHVVPFTIKSYMVSGSERDAIHVELRDTELRVLGNAVQNFQHDFVRK